MLGSRKLGLELLEDRRLLSIGPYPDLSGAHLVDPQPDRFDSPIISSDFADAELLLAPVLTSVQWKTASGETVADGRRFEVGDDVRIYVEADGTQIGDLFTVYVYEDDGADFDDLIDTVDVPILASDGTGYVNWEVPWNPDNNFTNDPGNADIYPEYRIWDTTDWAEAGAHSSDLIEAHGGELPDGKWTVIAHGFQDNISGATYSTLVDNGESGEGWMWQLADKMRDESIDVVTGLSNVVIHTVNAATGEIWNEDFDGQESLATIQDESKHHVLLFDWTEVSNYQADGDIRFRLVTALPPPGSPSDDGFAEASGDALYALLREYDIADKVDTFIGHSRGAIVITEAAQRVLGAGFAVDQVIFLDAEGGGIQSQFSDPAFGLYEDEQFWAWESVDTLNIFSTLNEGLTADMIAILIGTGLGWIEAAIIVALLLPDVDFGGHEVSGAKNIDLGALTYLHLGIGPIPIILDYSMPGVYDYLIGNHSAAPDAPGLFVVNGDILAVDTPSQASGTRTAINYNAPGDMELFGGDLAYDSTAGWWYHGGGSDAASAGGGTVKSEALILSQGQSRTHNWAYVPATARSIEFDLDVTELSSSGNLIVYWSGENGQFDEIGQFSLDSLGSHTNQRVDLPSGASGNVGQVRFSVEGSGATLVQLDNISWSKQRAQPPEIVVLGNGNSIADGDTTPNNSDHTDFGSALPGEPNPTRTYTVRNDGDETVTLGSVGIPDGYTLTEALSTSLAPGASDTFTVHLNTGALGTKTGSISFSINENDENPFNFSISGTVVAPEITVLGNGTSIGDGDTTPSRSDHTNFGNVIVDQPDPTRTYLVRNDGTMTLTLGNVSVPTGFTLTEGLATSLVSGASDTFTVRMDATVLGTKSGQISFSSNDTTENPFNFTIAGGVVDAFALIETSLVRQPTAFDDEDAGAVNNLPQSEPWIHEWASFYIEIWISTPNAGAAAARVDLKYNTDYFTATQIEYGSAFTADLSGEIDAAAGIVRGIGGRTELPAGLDSDKIILLARVRFDSLDGDQVDAAAIGVPLDLGLELIGGEMLTQSGDPVSGVVGAVPQTELWPVAYDINDDDRINYSDLGVFARNFHADVLQSDSPLVWALDFDNSGQINYGDLGYFARNFQKVKGQDDVSLPENFVRRWVGTDFNVASDAQIGDLLDTIGKEWSESLGLGEPINVRLAIRDLGGANLGEARITALDEDGIPSAGVVIVDDDAAGLGWYASLDSPVAAGKYDLYTVLLHETGHVYGFTDSYDAFAANIEGGVFTGRSLDLAMDADGDHLAVPDGVMRIPLEPGVRWEISPTEVAMVQAAYDTALSGTSGFNSETASLRVSDETSDTLRRNGLAVSTAIDLRFEEEQIARASVGAVFTVKPDDRSDEFGWLSANDDDDETEALDAVLVDWDEVSLPFDA